MEYSEQVVTVLSECVVKVVRQMLAEYNIQINNKLKNYIFSGDNIKALSITGANLASGSIKGSNLAAGTITGAQLADGTITGIKIKDGAIDTVKIRQLDSEIMNTVVANISKANIDWANIETLNAATAEIADAKIQNATITSAQISDLNATVADISLATIKTADIDFAKIKDVSTDTAIITKGVAGEFYVHNLKVTEANIDSLTAGQLILKNETDGKFYKFQVDESGNVTTTEVQIENKNIQAGAVTGSSIANGTIAPGNLNVGAIFGDEAVMTQITASMGKFANLFAVKAVVEQLQTHLVESDYMKVLIHDTIDLGGRNLLKKSGEKHSSTSYQVALYEFGELPPDAGEMVCVRVKGTLGSGKTGFRIANAAMNATTSGGAPIVDVPVVDLLSNGDGTYSASVAWTDSYIASDGTIRKVPNTHVAVCVQPESVTGVTSTVEWIMFERGNQMSDWVAAPEDTDGQMEGLETRVSEVELQIVPDQIVSTVRDSTLYQKDLNNITETATQSAVAQTSSSFNVKFSTMEKSVSDAKKATDTLQSQIDTWYNFSENGLEIGKSDSDYKTLQTNEKYQFLYKNGVVAEISGSALKIPTAEVSEQLTIGNIRICVDASTGAMEWQAV